MIVLLRTWASRPEFGTQPKKVQMGEVKREGEEAQTEKPKQRSPNREAQTEEPRQRSTNREAQAEKTKQRRPSREDQAEKIDKRESRCEDLRNHEVRLEEESSGVEARMHDPKAEG